MSNLKANRLAITADNWMSALSVAVLKAHNGEPFAARSMKYCIYSRHDRIVVVLGLEIKKAGNFKWYPSTFGTKSRYWKHESKCTRILAGPGYCDE